MKIASVTVVTLLVLGIANVYVVSRQHRKVMMDEFASKGHAIALSLASSSVEALLFYDASRIQSFIDSYRSLPGVSYIYLIASGGEMIAHTFVPAVPEGVERRNRLAAGQKDSATVVAESGGAESLDVAVPILYGVLGEVHVGMDLGIVRRGVRNMIGTVVLQFSLAGILSMVVLYSFLHRLIRPVTTLARASSRLGKGDLSIKVDAGAERRDELGDLAGTFNAMVGYLRDVIGDIRTSRGDLEKATGELSHVAGEIQDGARSEQESIRQTGERMNEMHRLSDAIRTSLAELSQSASRTGESTTRIHQASEEIRQGSRKLFDAVASTGGTLSELDASIHEVNRNVDSLRTVAVSAASAALQMDASVKSVEGKATDAAKITADLEEQFQEGIESVNRTIAGMDGIRELSSKVTSLIRNLSVSMENIENVLKLIVDINDQIGLLALNAAIIAAQAGSRGYGFSVVAEEMKALSERTEKSAKEIAKMVAGIQREAKGTLKAVNESEAQVDQNYLLSRKAGDVILSIQRGVHEANRRMTDIARATVEQAQMGTSVSRAAQDLSEAIERLSSASGEQATSSAHLLREAQSMKEVAESVDQSVDNQAKESQKIDQRMQEVNASMSQVWQATDAQLAGIGAVMDTVSMVNGISERNGVAARRLGEVMEILRQQAESLRRETERFSLGDQP